MKASNGTTLRRAACVRILKGTEALSTPPDVFLLYTSVKLTFYVTFEAPM